METLGNMESAKSAIKFFCKCCDYSTSRKCNFDDHLNSLKHSKNQQMETNGNKISEKSAEQNNCCEICCKTFISRSGLWKHRDKGVCSKLINNKQRENKQQENIVEPNKVDVVAINEIMKYLIKDNAELKSLILEQQKQQNMMLKVIENGVGNNSHNTTTHTNSHNKAFNLNFFLNETCKDAMNIGDFVDSLKLQLSDLEKVGEAGYIEGISSIIVKNLKELDVTKRPVHCTDKKRETVYIKDNDIWEKDDDKSKMHKLIKRVVSKNMNMFPKFREVHPDCLKYHSKYSDQYNKIVYESMGGKGDDDTVKNEKIIKNVLKEVTIDKNI
jgi:Txe/YoeB family toxin of Txe-Axe toxin-antitoxin module